MRRRTWIVLAIVMLFTASPQAYGVEYNSLLIRAQASIFPKIVLLDTDMPNKLENNTVVLHVVYDNEDKSYAESVKLLIHELYGNRIADYELRVDLVAADSKVNTVPSAYFLMDVDSDLVREVTSKAKTNNRICFSYNHKNLENNSLLSVQLKEKVYIYLSKNQLNAYGIKFQPVFYNIVKVVE